ncbi:hypothetical protein [Streptomyces sp. MST-110588]|uniref:hypothetical protein n=1 Tax=Streptomyces sp. MST-110588 TaxID=2833628 RepID=UPI001F5E00AB|nr:hypothetical protein [Streptomyces sp. MST-110588]UNO42315.1 hypothetical protein KGS77_25805 [Streptomyces sp. MST-110588]
MSRAYFAPPHSYSEPSVHLPLPGLPPVPVEGCPVCAHAAVWRTAYETGNGAPSGYVDRSAASDCNVEIRNHPHVRRMVALPINPPAVRP